MNKKLPLLGALLDYHKEENLILSMPGNKCGRAFNGDEIGKFFADNMGYLDITEVDPLDNLHHPEGIIKESQELLRDYYGAKKAYFMVNGSTNGNLAAIFSAFEEYDEVLVERNCHRSVYNALILRKLKVQYIEPVVDEKKGIFMPPSRENIYEALEKCSNPKGIVLTYPNYFGITYDIEDIAKELKDSGLKIIIDGAHGAHFNTSDKLPSSISNIGDYVVLSAHKTLPSLTSGAYLLVNTDDENIEFYLSAFMTTSPSYLIMASLDYARYYLQEYGERDYSSLISRANEWKLKINLLDKVNIISRHDLPKGFDLDESRYLMVLKDGYCGHKLLDYLREEKIQCEMSFSSGVVMILSPSNTEEDFNKIYKALDKLDLVILEDSKLQGRYYSSIPEKVLEPFEVFKLKYEYCSIDTCEGEIAKEAIIPYPPGIPVVCPGEIISKESINIINDYLNKGRTVIGINENKECKVVVK